MRAVLPVLLLSCSVLLAACGGGEDNSPASPLPAEPLIRFAATLSGGTLTVAPVAGAASIGTREIASVQLKVDEGAPQVLTAPTATNAAGQPLYVFAIPPAPGAMLPVPRCGFYRNHEITVTDVAGLALTKYQASCGLVQFGGFSDYGEQTVTFRVTSATAPLSVSFNRQGGDAGEYSDNAFSEVAGQRAWTLRAREGDRLFFGGWFMATAPEDATAAIAIEAGGAVLGSMQAVRSSAASLMIVCCRGTQPPGPAQPVTFFVYPTSLRPFDQGSAAPFTATLGIVDARGSIVHSFSGPGSGNTEWTFQAAPGDELRLEAAAGEQVSANVGIRVGGREVAQGNASVPGVPTRLNVFCCSLPRF